MTGVAISGAIPVPRIKLDLRPLWLVLAVIAIMLPSIGNVGTWTTLTIAGLAMGMIIFVVASGLTLVFGLMDVLNFGHGVFITVGAYLAMSVMGGLGSWSDSPSALLNVGVIVAALLVSAASVAAVGFAFEKVLIRPVYGMPLKQILVTMGGTIIGEEMIKMVWGPDQFALSLPSVLRGSIAIGDASVEKCRLLAVVVGLIILAGLVWTLNRTKVGLLVRAGVQDREMVEAFGYRIRRLFIGVFVGGAALAGLGGALWAMYQQALVPQVGTQLNALILIVIIMGGLGSTIGCFVGALLVGLATNYVGFLAPKAALFSTIALMVGVLLWRPRGLYPVDQV